ncbi:chaplin [Streptomyces sp. URMC 123]|uniref:chaplin n=1 Tax=Streptomyces sp. URMC 123 TaxID=3423403 RepID=UPI003F1C3D64
MIKKVVAVAAATGGLVLAGAGMAVAADSGAVGAAKGSPGVISGNVIQVPVAVPITACGNTVNVVGLFNPSFGNKCVTK